MRFTRLQLKNIGAFFGSYDFDLRTTDSAKNVILIGGQNGSGKTTILDSLRLALFGPLTFGYKTDSPAYYEKIDSKLNTLAKKQGEKIYQIILEFEKVEDFQKRIYTLRRRWELSKKTIKENFSVECDKRILNDKETEIFITRLREETPPQLLELCLFDGERIAQIISDQTLAAYLRDTARVIFNLDLFENMDSDLNNLIKQDSVYGSLSQEERQLHESEIELKNLRERRQTMIEEHEIRELELDELTALLAERNKEFDVHGGLMKDQRDRLMNELQNTEQQRRSMMDSTKESISSIFPFLLVKDLLNTTVAQMQSESVLDVQRQVKELVSVEAIQKLMESLPLQPQETMMELSAAMHSGILNLLATDTTETIHHASYQQRAEVERVAQEVRQFNPAQITKNFKKNQDMLQRSSKIRKQIDENDSASDLRNMLDQIHRLENKIGSLQLFLQQHLVSLTGLNDEIAQKEQAYEILKTQIVRAKKAENVFTITNRVLDVSRAFRSMQIKKKLQEVEWHAKRMLQSLYRKDLFVHRVSIDSSTFQMKLFNSTNEEINKENLSAGEKQILLLATVWAMVKCSRKSLPFVFDTLLGRLDQTHRMRLIELLIPQCGDQVIILATDSEINKDDFKTIRPIVARTYTIDFNTSKSTVDVSNDYFTFSKQEV